MLLTAFSMNECMGESCEWRGQITLHAHSCCLQCGTPRPFCAPATRPSFNRTLKHERYGQSERATQRRLKRAGQRAKLYHSKPEGMKLRGKGRLSKLRPDQELDVLVRHRAGESHASIGRLYGLTGQGIGWVVRKLTDEDKVPAILCREETVL